MTLRPIIFAFLTALAVLCAGLQLGADDAKDAKPAEPPKAAESKQDGSPKGDKGDKPRGEGPRRDGKDDGEKRPPRGDWGQRGDMPPREWGPGGPGARPPGRFEQFTPDELREMIAAVEATSNKKLAEKMKERLAEAITKKPVQLSQEQIDAALAVFEDREPHLAGRLKEYLKNDPVRVNAILAMQWPRLEKTIELKKTDRELYDAQTVEIQRLNDSRGISWNLRKAVQAKNEAEAANLKAQLRAKLVEQHEARQKIRKLELTRMNDKIKKLSEEITAEESKSAEQIDKHFQWLLKWVESPRGDRDRGERGEKGERLEKKEKAE